MRSAGSVKQRLDLSFVKRSYVVPAMPVSLSDLVAQILSLLLQLLPILLKIQLQPNRAHIAPDVPDAESRGSSDFETIVAPPVAPPAVPTETNPDRFWGLNTSKVCHSRRGCKRLDNCVEENLEAFQEFPNGRTLCKTCANARQ